MNYRSWLAALAFGLALILAVLFCSSFSSSAREFSPQATKLDRENADLATPRRLETGVPTGTYSDHAPAFEENCGRPILDLVVHDDSDESTASTTVVRYLAAASPREEVRVVAIDRLNHEGRCRLDFVGSGWLLVAVPGACPQVISVEQPGNYTISVSAAATFAGQVTIDGESPDVPLELVFESVEPAGMSSESGTSTPIPELVKKQLCIHRLAVDEKTGRFELRGLSPGWRLTLRAPVPYRFDGGKPAKNGLSGQFSASSVAAPDVVINLTRAPSVDGRLVANGTTSPQGARAQLLAVNGDARQLLGKCQVADDGNFELTWWPETRPPEFLEFELDYLKWTVAVPPSICPVIKLGDIAIPDCDRVSVRVIDAETHAPIEGAYLGRSGGGVLGRTDTNGQLSFLAEGHELELELVAAGYRFQQVTIPRAETLDETIGLELKKASVVTVTCLDLQDQVIPRARVFVTASQSILRDELAADSKVFQALCGAGMHLDATDKGSFANIMTDDCGVATIPDVSPNTSLDFSFATYGSNENGHLRAVVIHDDEKKEILLRAERPLRSLKIKVQDSASQPIAAATLRIGPPTWKNFLELTSDADGRAMVADLPFDTVIVEVTAADHQLWRESCDLSADKTELLVVLESVRHVDLSFSSADGTPMMPLMCLVRDRGFARGMAKADEIEPGIFRAKVASDSQFTVEVVIGIARHKLRVDAAKGSFQKLVLPNHTSIESDLPLRSGQVDSLTLALKTADGSIYRLPLDSQGRAHSSAPAGNYQYWFESQVKGKRSRLTEPQSFVIPSAAPIQLDFP